MSIDLTDDEKAKIDEAYASIMTAFDFYKGELKINGVIMQPSLLLCAVVSWILDESRHALFHGCEEIKRYKRASYFAYWFTWIKPIQVVSSVRKPTKQLVLVNERFAAFMVYSMLEIHEKGAIPKGFNDEMLYVLRYRNSSPESLFTTLCLLEISAKSGELRKAYPQKQVDEGPK
jgi:hypothetical protein